MLIITPRHALFTLWTLWTLFILFKLLYTFWCTSRGLDNAVFLQNGQTHGMVMTTKAPAPACLKERWLEKSTKISYGKRICVDVLKSIW